MADPVPLPPLREELSLLDAPTLEDGSPAWMLHDPARNRFFLIGAAELAILRHWRLANPAGVAAAASRDLARGVEAADVLRVLSFLDQHLLLKGQGAAFRARLLGLGQYSRNVFGRFLNNPLFLKIPLLNPQPWLRRGLPWINRLFQPVVFWIFLCCGLLAGWLILEQWPLFQQRLQGLLTPNGMLYFGIFLFFTKLCHELGHAFAAVRHGLHVPAMGVAFFYFWPVVYTEVPDIWRLAERRQKMAIAAAGLKAEAAVAVVAAVLWSFLPDGALRDGALAATVGGLLLTVTINLSPLVRYDGYYLLSIWLGIPNLQEQSMVCGRHWFRETFLGLAVPPGQGFTASRSLLVGYAIAAWLYRILISLTIALALYHWVFKALGLTIGAVLLYRQMVRPVVLEFVHWRAVGGWNRRVVYTVLGGVALLLLLFVPWHSNVYVPAVHVARERFTLYARQGARVVANTMVNGALVQERQPLMTLESPDLENELRLSARRLNMFSLQLQQLTHSEQKRDQLDTVRQRLAAEQAKQWGLQEQQRQLTVTAPVAGVLSGVTPGLKPGVWLNEGQALGRVLSRSRSEVVAILVEEELARLPDGARGTFYPDIPEQPPFAVTLVSVAPTAQRVLEFPELAATAGGPLETEVDGQGRQWNKQAVYRLLLQPEQPVAAGQASRGVVRLHGVASSLAQEIWRATAAVVIRHSGF